eukprot:EG_transcript_60937
MEGPPTSAVKPHHIAFDDTVTSITSGLGSPTSTSDRSSLPLPLAAVASPLTPASSSATAPEEAPAPQKVVYVYPSVLLPGERGRSPMSARRALGATKPSPSLG